MRWLKVWKEIGNLGAWEYQPLIIERWICIRPGCPTARYIKRWWLT